MNKLAVFVAFFAIILFTSTISASANFVSPKKQSALDISPADVLCREDYVKVIKVNQANPSCVKASTVEKLIERGWAKPIDPQIIQQMKEKTTKSIGQINTLAVVKVVGSAGKVSPIPPILGYNYVFEICAKDKAIKQPEIDVFSDSAAIHITFAQNILANTCHTSAVEIKAANPDSIKAVLLNKGGITDKISEFETKIADLQEKLTAEKSSLAKMSNEPTKPENYKKLASESSTKIIDLRNQLNQAREDLNRYLFLLHVSPSKANSIKTPLSFGGVAVEGELVNMLAIIEQVGVTETPPLYNVVYEVCAAATAIKAPSVQIKSDFESKTIVLADRVAPNTCQMGNGKVKAENQSSIMVSPVPTAEVSAKISQLEAKILELEQMITNDKRALNELTRKAQKPADFEMQVTDLTQKISKARNDINDAKTDLYRILFLYYQ